MFIPNVDKLRMYKESASSIFNSHEKCVTNGCKFRHIMKDFVDMISMDESIRTIKDNPQLYEDMLKFSYLNLDAFDFDKIVDSKYLSATLLEENISLNDLGSWEKTLNKLVPENIISYIIDGTNFNATKITTLLNNTINGLVDEDNIFYQIVTINYAHYLILSSLILTNKTDALLDKTDQLRDKLELNIKDDNTDNNIIIDLMKKIDEPNIKIYDFINSVFTYLYQYVNEFSDKTAPLTVINESMKIFKSIKKETVVKLNYIKQKSK